MKYLEVRALSEIAARISVMEEEGLEVKVEAYSMKETRRQRRERREGRRTPAGIVAETLSSAFPEYEFR
jgi:hypothetical protein